MPRTKPRFLRFIAEFFAQAAVVLIALILGAVSVSVTEIFT